MNAIVIISTILVILAILAILIIGYYFLYKSTPTPIPITPIPTTPTRTPTTPTPTTPTTPAPTTPIPTTPIPTTIVTYSPSVNYTFPTNAPSVIYTAPPSSPLSQKFEGTWNSFIYSGNEFGPVTILSKGENNFYILGEKVPSDLTSLTVDPNTLLCSFKYNSNFGTALIYGGKALKILSYDGNIYFERSNNTPLLTISPMSKDPFEGTWFSFKFRNKEYGPVTILSQGNNSYYISGENILSDLRLLTVDSNTLLCSLPQKPVNEFGTASIVNNKAISIFGNQDISFTRYAPVPTEMPTASPTSTDLFEGIWISYNYRGNEYGPVSIISQGNNSYYIYGGNVPDNDRRVLTVDPITLSCSLPREYNSNNFGTAIIYGGKAIKMYGNKGISFTRSNDIPNITVSPTSTDPFEGLWTSYSYVGNQYGPVTILLIGENSYYIYGKNVVDDNFRLLTVDRDTLSCSLPLQHMNSFGVAKIVNNKAISIKGDYVTFTR
jgi:hypothetical protein